MSLNRPLNGSYRNCCCDVVVLPDCETACAVGYVLSESDAESALATHANAAEVDYSALPAMDGALEGGFSAPG